MVRYTQKTKRKGIRHASRRYGKTSVARLGKKLEGGAIVHCPKCKDGRLIKSRGLTFCGFCGHEFE